MQEHFIINRERLGSLEFDSSEDKGLHCFLEVLVSFHDYKLLPVHKTSRCLHFEVLR